MTIDQDDIPWVHDVFPGKDAFGLGDTYQALWRDVVVMRNDNPVAPDRRALVEKMCMMLTDDELDALIAHAYSELRENHNLLSAPRSEYVRRLIGQVCANVFRACSVLSFERLRPRETRDFLYKRRNVIHEVLNVLHISQRMVHDAEVAASSDSYGDEF